MSLALGVLLETGLHNPNFLHLYFLLEHLFICLFVFAGNSACVFYIYASWQVLKRLVE